MGDRIRRALFILMRLYHNQAGNTLAIVAAAVIPLAALIGGGVDMSRAYMVRARMQQACDAAALAGRRAMTGATMTQSNIDEAKRFFDFNFPQKTFGAADFIPTIQSKPGETTTVQVLAATTIPTTIMRIFGKETLEIAVNCEARFDIGNTDVMLVLDTTGSMKDQISDGAGGTTTRLAALQQAVKDFYDTLGPGSNTTGRIRYGFIPYSSTVNVGYQLPSAYILGGSSGETAPYQSRRAVYHYETSSSTITCYRRYGLSNCYSTSSAANNASTSWTLTGTQCTSYGNNNGNGNPTTSGSAPSNTTTTTFSFDSYNNNTNSSTSNNLRSCVRKEVIVTKTYSTTYIPSNITTFSYWEYGQISHDVTGYITGNPVANPAYNAASNGAGLLPTSTWAGCIEERSTDSSINATTSTSSIPATAYDLQIDTLPNNTTTKWRPFWPEVEFSRSSSTSGSYLNSSSRISGGFMACPSQARKLAVYANRTAIPAGLTSSFDSYVNGLIAIGGTYHDIGMIWGARFLSPDGIFSSENRNAPNRSYS